MSLVLVGHSGIPGFPNAGAVGVNLFFALSGFLITSLLLEERATTGRVRFGAFYRRRALRLLPALVALLIGIWVVRLVFQLDDRWITWGGTAAALLYFTNILIFFDSSGAAVAHTWSLSLEEQFYLTWPALLVLLFRWRSQLGVLVGALALGLASVVSLYVSTGELRSFAPDTRSCFLLFGCALAAYLSRRAADPPRPHVAWFVVGVTLLTLSSFTNGGLGAQLAPPATIVGSTLLLLVAGTTPLRAMEGRVLRWLGQRSYALYLWHFPLMVVSLGLGMAWPFAVTFIWVGSFVLAELSWRIVERPFLRLKDRLDGHGTVPSNEVNTVKPASAV